MRLSISRPTYRAQRILTSVIVALLWAASIPSATRAQSQAENLQRFEQVWRTTRDRFYDPALHGVDWRAVGDRYRDEAEAAGSKRELESVVNRMLAELHASHLAYVTDDDVEYYLLQSVFKNDMDGLEVAHIGVMGEQKDNGFIVRALLDGGPAAKAGVMVGDRLLEVEGQPFSTVGAFRGKAGTETDLMLDRPAKGRMTLTVTPVKQNPQRAFLEATKRSVRIFERNGRRIGYIHLWCMTNDLFRQAMEDALIGKLADTDGVILDIRDGFGGHPFRFTDVLFRPDVAWGQTYRSAGPGVNPVGAAGASVGHTGFAKPLVVLINHGSRSAKEYFAYQVKKSKRGTLVGTTTAGAFLGAGGFPIGPDGYLELPVVGLTLDGKRIEGVGVSPDVVEEDSRSYGPDDRQLERATTVLLDKLHAKPRKDDFVTAP